MHPRLSISAPVAERRYSVHGLSVAVRAEPRLLRALDRRLRSFTTFAESPSELRFDFAAAHVPSAPGNARPIYDPEDGTALYDEQSDTLYLRLGDAIQAVCDPARGWTEAAVDAATSRDRWLASHALLTLPLLETLKRRGLFGVHAAGVARNGRGLVLAGGSGSGKTTLALALADAGFEFLSDDMLFLSRVDGDVQLLAFPDEVDVTQDTAQLIERLRPLLDEPRRPGWPKWSFRLDDVLLDTRIEWSCPPAAVVFPRISDVEHSRLEPMPPGQALLELVPNVLLTSGTASQAHLAMLARLTSGTPCYRLWTGRDFPALAVLLGDLLT